MQVSNKTKANVNKDYVLYALFTNTNMTMEDVAGPLMMDNMRAH